MSVCLYVGMYAKGSVSYGYGPAGLLSEVGPLTFIDIDTHTVTIEQTHGMPDAHAHAILDNRNQSQSRAKMHSSGSGVVIEIVYLASCIVARGLGRP